MRKQQQGFTLVELVVVIVVLGILAAIAIPRYANYTREARIASLNGLAGALRSAVGLVQARYVAAGTGTSPVTLADGSTVVVSTGAAGGIPTVAVAGIEAAVNQTGFVFVPATGVWNLPTAIANCNVTYAATGAVTVDPTNC
jgi:MSHA pilin protein MshA